MKIEIHRLGNGEYVECEGRYYATVNGKNVGETHRAFWPTRNLAQLCAERYILAQRMIRALKMHRGKQP